MRSWIIGAWVLAAGFVVAAGCSSDEALAPVIGSTCTLNSDCHDPLSCAFGKCHQQCKETRDCLTPGARCVKVESGTVCQLPEEIPCSGATCQAGQVCGSNNGCIATCTDTSTCQIDQTCAADTKGSGAKVCAEKTEVAVDGTVTLAPVSDAGTAGAGGSSGSGGSGAGGAAGSGGSSGGSGGTAGSGGGIADSGPDVSSGGAGGMDASVSDSPGSVLDGGPGTELWVNTTENSILVADIATGLPNNGAMVAKKQFATLKTYSAYGTSVVQDKWGNVWTGQGGHLWRYPAALFAGATNLSLPVPDQAGSDFDSPAYSPALWLDRVGNLWSWHDNVYALRLPVGNLNVSAGELNPGDAGAAPLYDYRFNGTVNWITFDSIGNTWTITDRAKRFSSDEVPPVGGGSQTPIGVTFTVSGSFPSGQGDFDKDGNLWALGSQKLRRVAASELVGNVNKVAAVTDVTLTDAAMNAVLTPNVAGFTFDSQGNLWVCGSLQYILKYDAATIAAAVSPDGGPIQIAHSLKINSPLAPSVHFKHVWFR